MTYNILDILSRGLDSVNELNADGKKKMENAPERNIEFKRSKDGSLWSFDADTGENLGKIGEFGDEGVSKNIDIIEEI